MVTTSTPARVFGVLLMSAQDNCVIARSALCAGDIVLIDGQEITLTQAIDIGHKLARRALAIGEKVVRYGAPIGSVSQPIAIGQHIHTHNLESDYIPTYTLSGDGHHFIER
ncbi:UxaA family hydrolase [Glaciimonas sp. PCH181]|uniref:UxaA family hydrolase n=1 Tax=Glaciimonas sp. PCH181 TaxID=2133943 RepID=UPI000D39E4FF|nr:UxaA family hydrolase [Glaciimonas sp. PCH181]PUA17401.1 hydrolase [Glaciimonas sp. PCH181]